MIVRLHKSFFSNTSYLTIGLIIIVALPRILSIGQTGLWLDELANWAFLDTADLTQLVWLLFDPHAGYPLYHLFMAFWIACFGDSEIALRMPSVLANIATVLCIGACARNVGRSHNAVMLLLIAAPFSLGFAQEATVYSLLMLWGAIVLWALLHLLTAEQRIFPWLVLLLPFGMLLHRAAVLSVIAVLIVLALRPAGANRPAKGRYLLVLMVLLISGLTMALLITRTIPNTTTNLSASDLSSVLWRTIWAFTLNNTPHDNWFLLLIPTILLVAFGGVRLLATPKQAATAQALFLLALLPVVLLAGQSLITGHYEPRYLAAAFPVWAVLAAPQRIETDRLLMLLVIGTQVVANLQPGGVWGPTPQREQYREALTSLFHTLQPDDRILIYPQYIDVAWRYYAPRLAPSTPHLPVALADNLPPAWPGQREFVILAPFHAAIENQQLANPPSLSNPTGTSTCGSESFHGIELRCRIVDATLPLSPRPILAIIGESLILRDLVVTVPLQGFAPGDTLPMRLEWEALRYSPGGEQMMMRLTRVGSNDPIRIMAGPILGTARTNIERVAGSRMTDRWTIPLIDQRGQPIPAGSYRITLSVHSNGQPLTISGDASMVNNEVTLAIITVQSLGPRPCVSGSPAGCGQIRPAGKQLFDYRGRWEMHGVQFFLPKYGISEQSFWDTHYWAAINDQSLELWLDRAALRLNPNMLRIFIMLPYQQGDQIITPTSYATIFDFAQRAAARDMRLGLILHNSNDWSMTPARQRWIEGLLSYFLERNALDTIAYLSADNEINNHCQPARQFDCFASDPHYRDAAIAWVDQFSTIVHARTPQMLVTTGMATELDSGWHKGGITNYFVPAQDGRTLAKAIDFLSPHNYGGNAEQILRDIRATKYQGPVLLEEYGFPTDPVTANAQWSEGSPLCRENPLHPACIATAPYYVELNLNALRHGGYAGGSAWMLADTLERDQPNACARTDLPSDLWAGLLAAGHTYCDGGTLIRKEGASKATAVRVCAYYTGSATLCLADAIQRSIP